MRIHRGTLQPEETTMPSQAAPTDSLDQIPVSVLHRWMMKAALCGFLLGTVAAIAALQAA
jgi:hypothetical protein